MKHYILILWNGKPTLNGGPFATATERNLHALNIKKEFGIHCQLLSLTTSQSEDPQIEEFCVSGPIDIRESLEAEAEAFMKAVDPTANFTLDQFIKFHRWRLTEDQLKYALGILHAQENVQVIREVFEEVCL